MNLSSNRINQNAPRNQRQPAGRPAAPAPSRPQVQQANTLSNYGTTTRIRSLFPGQVIKGEVSDLRNTEIVVTLENNTIVAGKLQNGNWLAIGETAAFKVVSASQETIVLEALPRTDMALANSTVQKALEEAGLPKTDKNQQIVLELMNNQLPIHKQAIQQMLQLSFQHKEVSIPTLVLLHKLQIPITAENALQMEQYRQNEHALTTQLNDLSDTLCTLIQETASQQLHSDAPAIQFQINQTSAQPGQVGVTPDKQNLVSQGATSTNQPASSSDAMTQAAQTTTEHTEPFQQSSTPQPEMSTFENQSSMQFSNTASQTSPQVTSQTSAQQVHSFQENASRILSAVLEPQADEVQTVKTVLPDTTLQLSQTEQQDLCSILDNFEFPETQREAITSNTASLRDVIHLIHQDFEQAFALDQEMFHIDEPFSASPEKVAETLSSETASETKQATTPLPTEPFSKNTLEQPTEATDHSSDMLRISLFDHPVIQNIEKQFSSLQIASKELGGKLNQFQRIHFSECINALPIDQHVKDKVVNGEINSRELLRIIKTVLPFSDAKDAATLLSSDTFSSLLKEEFLRSFLLSPADMIKEGGIQKYYHKLSKQLDDLDQLLNHRLLNNSTLAEGNLMSGNGAGIKETVGQLKSNLDFMKLLNQFFSYVQLPVNTKEQATHADLYVYTRKETLKKKNASIHALLHLNMDHLGGLDVDVTLNNRTVTAKFSVEDDKIARLFSSNLSLLEDALLEKGYLCHSSVEKEIKTIDLVKDFIEPGHTKHGITRYSFDLRA